MSRPKKNEIASSIITAENEGPSLIDIVEGFKRRSLNVKYASVCIEENDTKSYAAKDGSITSKADRIDIGARAKVVIETFPGSGNFSEVYAHTDRTSPDGIYKMLRIAALPQAHGIAASVPKDITIQAGDEDVYLSGNGAAPFLGLAEKKAGIKDKYSATEAIKLDSVPEAKKETLLKNISKYLAEDRRLMSGRTMYQEVITKSRFADTEGADIEQRIPRVELMVDLLAKADSPKMAKLLSAYEREAAATLPQTAQQSTTNGLRSASPAEFANYRYFEKLTSGVGGYEIVEDAFKEHTAKERIDYIVAKAAKLAGAESAPSQVCNVIMDGELASVWIHEALGHICELDSIVEGESKLMDRRLGDQIASPLLNVYEDPRPVRYPGHSSKTLGCRKYDDDGVPTRKYALVENGKLVGYLSGRSEAAVFEKMMTHKKDDPSTPPATTGMVEIAPGVFLPMRENTSTADAPQYTVKGASSSGHSRAENWSKRPLVRMANTQVAYSKKGPTIDEMAESAGSGIYAKGSLGGYVDPTNGNFVFWPKEVYTIEDGKIRHDKPLKDIVLTDNTLSSIRKINDVGGLASVRRFHGACGKGGQYVPVEATSPALRIDSLVVQERVTLGGSGGARGGGSGGYSSIKNAITKNNGVLYSALG